MPTGGAHHNGPVPDDADPAALVRWLASPAAAPALAAARTALSHHPGDPLAAGTALRSALPDLPAAEAAAVLDQATLNRRAAERGMLDHDRPLLLTRDGLEAGTRPELARRRGRLLAAAGATRVLDLTGGLGFDAAGFLAAGLDVTAVERDPSLAAMLAHNLPSATVVCADAQDAQADLIAGLADTDVVFADPARRDPNAARDAVTARARPERDPERWSPPWSAIAAIPHPRIAAKVAPGFDPPPGWEAEWTSIDRTVVECALFSWPISGHPRRAVVVTSTGVTVVPGDPALVPPVADDADVWLVEPDPAVLRAHALGALADAEGLSWLGEGSTWLTGPTASDSPALRSYLVIEAMHGSHRQQRRRLSDLGITHLTVKSRDVGLDPREVRRSLGVVEGPAHVLVMTRRDSRIVSWLTQPAAARPR